MRNAGHAARLQHRHAAHDLHHAAVRISQADDAAAALPVPARHTRYQNGKQRCDEGVTHPDHQAIEECGIRRCRARMVLRKLRDPGRILGQRHDLSAALERAKNCQRRHQERERVKDRLPALVPRLQAQPEPEPNHGVDPGDDQYRELKCAA